MRDPSALSARLLDWYDANARDLPWRRAPSPYEVLLSEVMLQQTRVETVRPYYARFLAAWPTVEALAAAPWDEVQVAWAGLGYYSRARNLHRAAQAVAAAGGFPRDAAALRALPGVGPYTAGAVASIAFGQRAAAVDGNVERVLSRLDALEADPRSPAGRRALDARALELQARRPGDVTQALIELGATVCAPRRPRCGACPLEGACAARATGREASLPNKAKKPPPRAVRGVAGALVQGARVLCGRRPPTGLLADFWEPVGVDLADGEAAEAALARAFRERAGLEVDVGAALGEVVHVFTHRRLSLVVHRVAVRGGEARASGGYQALAWIDPAAPDVALSALARKALALAGSALEPGARRDGPSTDPAGPRGG